MFCRRLGLVEPGQPAVVAFIEPPILFDRQPEPPHFLERDVERLDRARLQRGEAVIEIEPLVAHQRTRRLGFGSALLGHIDIPPAGETIFKVPA